jgi:hypothetical protein
VVMRVQGVDTPSEPKSSGGDNEEQDEDEEEGQLHSPPPPPPPLHSPTVLTGHQSCHGHDGGVILIGHRKCGAFTQDGASLVFSTSVLLVCAWC